MAACESKPHLTNTASGTVRLVTLAIVNVMFRGVVNGTDYAVATVAKPLTVALHILLEHTGMFYHYVIDHQVIVAMRYPLRFRTTTEESCVRSPMWERPFTNGTHYRYA